MNVFQICKTDIILQNYEKLGQGKIIVSDNYMGSFSYVWGSMGSSIEEFLQSINSGYFADKLCPNNYVFSGKKSVSNIRRFIRLEMSYDLPWYKFMSAQKEMREKLKELESCDSGNEFVDSMNYFVDSLMCCDLSSKEEQEFKEILKPTFETEPWYFIGQDTSREYNFLYDLHSKIKKHLQKQDKDKFIKAV